MAFASPKLSREEPELANDLLSKLVIKGVWWQSEYDRGKLQIVLLRGSESPCSAFK